MIKGNLGTSTIGWAKSEFEIVNVGGAAKAIIATATKFLTTVFCTLKND